MRLTILLLHLVAISSLSGCASTKDIQLADGTIGHEITCDGRERSIETCFEMATGLCGKNGFETVTREGLSTGRTITKGSTDPNSGPFATRSILVRCKDQRPIPQY